MLFLNKIRNVHYAFAMTTQQPSQITILYDGQCPLCSSYVKFYRLQKAADHLVLTDARQSSELKTEITAKGWDLDAGMVVKIGENYYFGSDAMYMLALMSTRHGWLNRLNVLLFGTKGMAHLLYPLCKASRWIVLRLRGIPNIRNLER